MREDIQARLRRLGVMKGTRHLKEATRFDEPGNQRQSASEVGARYLKEATRFDEPQPLDKLLPGGRLEETTYGSCFVLDKIYPLTYRHGADHLADLCCLTPEAAATFCRDPRLATLDFRQFLLLDTETTGLTGAGTIAFMVGVGFFEDDAFVVRQYFLRDHSDEPPMLLMLADLLAGKSGLITFNGRTFDLPLLDGRYLMNRIDLAESTLLEIPHIDLLPPSRRLWRSRIGSCGLSSLERNVLGLQRSQADVPGWAIPGLYLDYLRHGDARELLRVFYHNEMDILSMATLAGRVVRQFEQPDGCDYPEDLHSLARWQANLGLVAEAEQSLRLAASLDLPLELYHRVLHELGALLKRHGRREEAVQLWQQIATTTYDDVAAHVELAKHYEWQHGDVAEATAWTQQALALVESWAKIGTPAAYQGRVSLLREELQHRLTRLEKKQQHDAPVAPENVD